MIRRAGAVALVVAAVTGGCNALVGNDEVRRVEERSGVADASPPREDSAAPSCAETVAIHVAQEVRTKIDLLFMIDNSPSMEPKAAELRRRFPAFFKTFQDLAAQGIYVDLHIGVVTSDYGAGQGVLGNCDASPGGQRGALQAVGAAAGAGCAGPVNANHAEYRFTPGSAVSNLPPNQDLPATFTCMASVGESGCGFEHPLESVYAALRTNASANTGFLRDDAVLAIVLLSDEDDASAPPDTDVFSGDKVQEYGPLRSYSRQTRFAITCGANGAFPPYGSSGGPLAACVPAASPPGKQYDVSRYIDLFTKPLSAGGLKTYPEDVMLFAIDAPSAPFEVILASGSAQPYATCAVLDEAAGCVPTLKPSCGTTPGFYGDPAVRINAVVDAVKTHRRYSICDTDYSAAAQDASRLIVARDPGCVPRALTDPARPSCEVADVSAEKTTALPSCASAGGAFPCWRIEPKPACSESSPQGVGITVDRGGQLAPPGGRVAATCQACGG